MLAELDALERILAASWLSVLAVGGWLYANYLERNPGRRGRK